MKFSTLSAAHRSALAAICNSGVLTTDKLAKVMGSISNPVAAHQLCAMRKAGLIFSHQKVGSEQFCKWEVTTLGEALFNGRPGAELVFKPEAGAPAVTKFVVVTNFDHGAHGTREQALLAAQHLASEGKACTVLGLVADVTPPEQPLPVVTLL